MIYLNSVYLFVLNAALQCHSTVSHKSVSGPLSDAIAKLDMEHFDALDRPEDTPEWLLRLYTTHKLRVPQGNKVKDPNT